MASPCPRVTLEKGEKDNVQDEVYVASLRKLLE